MRKPRSITRTFPDQAEYWLVLNAPYVLTDTTNEQKLFDGSTNGALTLQVGTYWFECLMVVTAMSGTSGNCAFDILGAGTGTIGSALYHTWGADVSAITGVNTKTGVFTTQGQTAASMVTAALGSAVGATHQGTFRLTTAGTIIPSLSLVTGGVTPAVATCSYFRCKHLGHPTVTAVGPWS